MDQAHQQQFPLREMDGRRCVVACGADTIGEGRVSFGKIDHDLILSLHGPRLVSAAPTTGEGHRDRCVITLFGLRLEALRSGPMRQAPINSDTTSPLFLSITHPLSLVFLSPVARVTYAGHTLTLVCPEHCFLATSEPTYSLTKSPTK